MPHPFPKCLLPLLLAALLPACASLENPAFLQLAQQPLPEQPWAFADRTTANPGHLITTPHYHLYTTIDDPLYQHLLARILEATHTRAQLICPNSSSSQPLDCYVFSTRSQWETYTRARAGSNAPIYLQISSGGYSQQGVFAGYDVGRDLTLSVVAHEAWHQYSWFAFKDRLPAWLEEGLATQNESIAWSGSDPLFTPEANWRRMAALRQALRTDRLWDLPDLLSTHAGLVIRQPQSRVDAYYAQLWSFTLFLQQSPLYGPRLQSLLADATAGKLTQSLAGTPVTRKEIDDFSERWNTIAGPVYLQKYINQDLHQLDREYHDWLKHFTQS